jgi:hypothetical protein
MLVRTSGFNVTVPALLFEPEFHLFDCVPERGLTKFLVVREEMLARAPFIDIRFEPLAQAQFWVSTAELFTLESSHDVARPESAFIFHHAFVCSTLLAKCLNGIDTFFSLKEPWILRRLADLKRARASSVIDPAWRETFCRYVGLLCRNFRTGRTPVIKATNVANNLLEDVLELLPAQPVLYLYSDLESFLISTLKKSDDTRQKMSGLAQSFLRDGDFAQRFPQICEPSRWTSLQACAIVWLVSLYNLECILRRFPQAVLRTLDARAFLDDQPGTLAHLSRFFGHDAQAAEIARMTDRSIVEVNAKEPSAPYSAQQRQKEMSELASRHGRELAEVRAWIEPAAAEIGAPDFLLPLRLAR